ncbi:MAG TPA: GntR family transcriptional regulator [Kineosporiaceae bacterium]
MSVARSGELGSPSLVELATDRLRHEILSGELSPGSRLVEGQVCTRLGISRAPLREALRHLGEQGLVEHLPRRGVRVATLSPRDVEELFDVRDLLERHAVQLALPLKERHLDGVRAELEEMRVAARSGDAYRRAEAHRRFHAEVVALADHRHLLMTYASILVRLQLHMAVNLRREAAVRAPMDGVQRHEVLLAALESDDAGVVLAALERHGARAFL